jgi:hypothetical protein
MIRANNRDSFGASPIDRFSGRIVPDMFSFLKGDERKGRT